MPVLVLHYREIWLKGANRGFFVQKLKEAVAQALEGLPAKRSQYEDHRMFVPVPSHADALLAVERLRKVPGIAYLAIAEQTEPQMDAIVETGCRLMANETFRTFRVRARRSQKSLPFRSADIERSLGAAIGRQSVAAGKDVKVDLAKAEATCFVEVTATRALIYHEKIPGSGGLPTGTAGKLVCLLSGGFDSAVAAYKVIKRGVRLTFVHFYGVPARAGEDSPPIARELVGALTPYQGLSRLYLVPFTDIQREIVVGAPESCRILLYRRFMLRIAERLAYRGGAHGLVTGDSIGQVASQTLHNMQGRRGRGLLAHLSPTGGRRQAGDSGSGTQNRDLRHIQRTLYRLLPHVSAQKTRAFCHSRATHRSRVQAGHPGSSSTWRVVQCQRGLRIPIR